MPEIQLCGHAMIDEMKALIIDISLLSSSTSSLFSFSNKVSNADTFFSFESTENSEIIITNLINRFFIHFLISIFIETDLNVQIDLKNDYLNDHLINI